jgi:hypothetical protein
MARNRSRSDDELRDAWADLAYFQAAVYRAKEDVVCAQLQLVDAHAALADANRLTRLSSLTRIAHDWARARST